MTKDQFYRVSHISKATALYLLYSGLVSCIDSGKKTRKYTIKTDDVINYLVDRKANPGRYIAPDGWYAGRSRDYSPATTYRAELQNLSNSASKRFRDFLTVKFSGAEDELKSRLSCFTKSRTNGTFVIYRKQRGLILTEPLTRIVRMVRTV